jgi:hypothetical protein
MTDGNNQFQILQNQNTDIFRNVSPQYIDYGTRFKNAYAIQLTTHIQAIFDGKKQNTGLIVFADNNFRNANSRTDPIPEVNRTVFVHKPISASNIYLRVWYTLVK